MLEKGVLPERALPSRHRGVYQFLMTPLSGEILQNTMEV